MAAGCRTGVTGRCPVTLPATARTLEHDDYRARGEARLAAAGLPWCFGEMSYPHWRRVPISCDDSRSASYYAGDDVDAREAALTREILCSRCPVFDRCNKLTIAKKSPNPDLEAAEKKANLLAALGRM